MSVLKSRIYAIEEEKKAKLEGVTVSPSSALEIAARRSVPTTSPKIASPTTALGTELLESASHHDGDLTDIFDACAIADQTAKLEARRRNTN